MDQDIRDAILSRAMDKEARFGRSAKKAGKKMTPSIKRALIRMGLIGGGASAAGAAGGYQMGKEEYGLIRDAEGEPVGKRKLRAMIRKMYGRSE